MSLFDQLVQGSFEASGIDKDEFLKKKEKPIVVENKETPQVVDNKNERTIFVGNLPLDVAKSKTLQKKFRKLFEEHGEIESFRYRSISFDGPLSKKDCFKKGLFNEKRSSMNAYIVFKTTEAVVSALQLNGSDFEGHYMRVDGLTSTSKDVKRSVFVGNVPFDAKENDLWNFFKDAGEIDYVRMVRDKESGMGRGIAYVQYQEKSSVDLALRMDGLEFNGKLLRIQPCKRKANKINEKPKNSKKKEKKSSKKKDNKSRK